MKIHARHRAKVGQNRRRGWPVGEQIDFRRAVRANQRGSQSRRACRDRHRGQIGERPAKIGQVRRLRMSHLRFECVCDHAELVAHWRLIDYFQPTATRLVDARARAVVRAHPGAEIEHQRMAAAVTD